MNVSLNFTPEKCMACDISIRKVCHFLFWYFNNGSKRKDLKSKHFALFGLKTN